jgi:hypothetical protein
MEIEIFALCDAATESGGKLNILGAFDRISSRQFPSVHPHCAIAIRIRFDRIEEGEHRVRVNFVDSEGKPVIPGPDGNIKIQFPERVQSVCANMVLVLNGITIEKPGLYSIDLAIDGRYEKSLPLHVVGIAPANETLPIENSE